MQPRPPVLRLSALQADASGGGRPVTDYRLGRLRARPLPWDRVARCTHLTDCWYQYSCCFNVFVADGVALREEQVGSYPPPADPDVPDFNPRGCPLGAGYVHRIHDPMRVKYPLKRVGERGGGRWCRIPWDQALTEIADRLLDVLAEDGPAAVALAGGSRVHGIDSNGAAMMALWDALGIAHSAHSTEEGDDHQGAAVTFGKDIFADSADNWFHADLILVWGGNPAYTNVANYHFISEARYHGTHVVAISPDYNASCPHADQWVPVRVGSDAALALGMAGVILREGLHRTDFVREQTDLPLLVRRDTGLFLRERDLRRGGREDVFYVWDEAAGRLAPAPRTTLVLGDLVPALAGEFTAGTLEGPVAVRPVMAALREKLDAEYRPEQAAALCGVPAATIVRLARRFAGSRGVVNISTANFSKFYHGDLIERAIILLFALCGHVGRRGASYNAFPFLTLDTALGTVERRGQQELLSAWAGDPRYAGWRADGYTDEMVITQYAKDAVASGSVFLTSMFYFVHGGLLAQSLERGDCDPDLRRPLGEYVDEALAKGWQVATPAPGRPPRVLLQVGGNFLRRVRNTDRLRETLIPGLDLMVTVDWRLSSTALHSDYVLPASSWYERFAAFRSTTTLAPFAHVNDRAVEPLYESKSDWEVFVLLARALQRRAAARGLASYRDARGVEHRLDRLEDRVTCGGMYDAEDEEAVARDTVGNATNIEAVPWEEMKQRGFVRYTGLGTSLRSIGNATDIVAGQPVVPLTRHVQGKEPYPTLTRRIQFHIDHPLYVELGEVLPTHKEPLRAGGDHPLVLTGGHARWSIHSDWVDDALMLRLQRGEPVIFLSVPDARARGVADGDRVEVHNDVGRFRALAQVAPGIRPGQAVMYHAWENFQFEGWAHFKSVMASPLNPVELAGGYGQLRADMTSLAPGHSDRDTRVEVRRVP